MMDDLTNEIFEELERAGFPDNMALGIRRSFRMNDDGHGGFVYTVLATGPDDLAALGRAVEIVARRHNLRITV